MLPAERIRWLMLPVIILVLLPILAAAECSHEFVERREEPTCTGGGLTWLECIHCGNTTGYRPIDPVGHSFGDWFILEGPTCTRDGTQARECGVCGHREEAELPRLGHDYVMEVVPPTCTARGKTVYECSRCHDRYITDETPPLGHRYDDGVVLSDPTSTAMGRMLFTCTGCGDTYQQYIPKLTNPFLDISKNAYYYEPVLWAVYRGITTGLDESHFGPDAVCNRAQLVTFLWRAAGKPEPRSRENPFVDVPDGCFYEQAVLWAYENGITTGTDGTHFSPEALCNRAQVVTFLHRSRGCPEPEVIYAFPDVPPGSYFREAVLWAAQRGITNGMDGGLFRPELSCSRAQIVTFLYRDAKNP